MAPHRLEVEQHEALLAGRALEDCIGPLLPLDAIGFGLGGREQRCAQQQQRNGEDSGHAHLQGTIPGIRYQPAPGCERRAAYQTGSWDTE
jgi:hypothetical protein